VIVTLDSRPENLGVGYRLDARFFTGEKQNALVLPRSAVMQATGEQSYVLTVEHGELVRHDVTVGLENDLQVEIASGLDEHATVLAYPDPSLSAGTKVKPRLADGP